MRKGLGRKFHMILSFFIMLKTSVFLAEASGVQVDTVLKKLEQANTAYDQGHYQDAKSIYLSLLKNGIETGGIYYNLGNASYRLGEMGKALFYFLNAKQLLPRDEDVIHNLQFLRQKRTDGLKPFSSWWESWLELPLSERELNWSLVAVEGLFFLILALTTYLEIAWIKPVKIILLLVACSLLVIKIGPYFQAGPRGVVLYDNVKVKSSLGMDSVTLFTLNEGAEVTILEELDKHYKIAIFDGKRGLMSKDNIISSFREN